MNHAVRMVLQTDSRSSITDGLSYLNWLNMDNLWRLEQITALRRIITTVAFGSHQGIFGGENVILQQLKELKKASQILKSSLLQPKKSGKGKLSMAQRLPVRRHQLEGPRAKGKNPKKEAQDKGPRKYLATLRTTT